MRTRLLAGLLSTGMMLASLASAADAKKKTSGMSEDMRQAIAWERHKDAAAARQARIEAGQSSADRSVERKGKVSKKSAPKSDKQ